ncbi:MAG: thioredoxin family protein [Bacteroidota bacterium]
MSTTVTEKITNSLPQAMSYAEYRDLVARLASEGRSTGPEQTEALSNYTMLNDRRMRRFDKTIRLEESHLKRISSIQQKLTFLVITESWCGDAAPSLPVIHKITQQNPNFSLKVLLRDENLELMQHFLTNGTLSIPKLIIVEDGTGNVWGDWGPRPSTATQMVEEYKEAHGKLTPEFKEGLQKWYNKDKGKTVLNDILQLLALE